MSNRSTTIRFPVLNGRIVHVILARDVTATGRRLGADLHDAVAAYIHATDTPGKRNVSWLVFPATPDEGTIAHEASHAIRAIFTQLGMRNDNEGFAYHLDYLVGRIHKFVKKGQK